VFIPGIQTMATDASETLIIVGGHDRPD